MLRMSRLTDYATVVLAQMAAAPERLHTASELAAGTGLTQTTVSKLLKAMARSGLLSSQRGASGGYTLARPAARISAADVLDALEGPVALTECSSDDGGCEYEAKCRVGNAWQVINAAIRRALEDISLVDLVSRNPRFGPLRLGDTQADSTASNGDTSVPMHFRPRA
ncbi:MAG: SUF system Fe-S cluster assembly regulator [Gammaproteobacteria bacterium]|nr:SUF system Fe-S cluster assembly regulator [Gammaproteobacteria bacterium]